jgi:hypothetical protein
MPMACRPKATPAAEFFISIDARGHVQVPESVAPVAARSFVRS